SGGAGNRILRRLVGRGLVGQRALDEAHPISVHHVRLAVQMVVDPFHQQRESGQWSGPVDEYRKMPDDVPLDVRGLVAMVIPAPDEYAKAVELIRLEPLGNRCP